MCIPSVGAPEKEMPAAITKVPPPNLRALFVFIGCVQNILGGGLIIGWPGIAGSLLVAQRNEGGAEITLEQTTAIFAQASCTNFLSPLVLGVVLDRYGPRACSVVSNAFVCLGCFVISLAAQEGITALAIGVNLIAFGGPGFQSSLVHLSNLYPRWQFLVMSCTCGTITLSFAVFPLMDMLWQRYGFGLSTLFGTYSIIMMGSTFVSFLLWPDVSYELETVAQADAEIQLKVLCNESDGKSCHNSVAPMKALNYRPGGHMQFNSHDIIIFTECPDNMSNEDDSVKGCDTDDPTNTNIKDQSFWKQVRSGPFVRVTILFVVMVFWANFYVGTITIEIQDKHDFTVSQQEQLIRWFTCITSIGLIGSPLVGFILDNVGLVFTAFATISLGIIQLTLLLSSDITMLAMIQSFLSYSLLRSFLFPYLFSCLSHKLGFKYFGSLSGISLAISGMAQLPIAQLSNWATGTCHSIFIDLNENPTTEKGSIRNECDQGKWDILHNIQLVSFLVLTIIPILDVLLERTRKNQEQPVSHILASSKVSTQTVSKSSMNNPYYGSTCGKTKETIHYI